MDLFLFGVFLVLRFHLCCGIIRPEFIEDIPSPTDYCDCVPFLQCQGSFREPDANSLRNCSGYLDVCCYRAQCGTRDRSNLEIWDNDIHKYRILGDATTAEFAEFPWMLGILKNGAYKCGASLIHPKVALTAAHCVNSEADYMVRAGEWNWEHTNEPLPHQDRLVTSIKIHPNFETTRLSNDIALLLLQDAFNLDDNVGIICLPFGDVEFDSGRCLTSGWGRNSPKKGSYQSVLKKVDLPIVPRDTCEAILRNYLSSFNLDESFICAGGEYKKDTCKGDGGSPLIRPIFGEKDRFEQVGIVSWGLTCGVVDAPGAYVDISKFNEWIDEEMVAMFLDKHIYRYNNLAN